MRKVQITLSRDGGIQTLDDEAKVAYQICAFIESAFIDTVMHVCKVSRIAIIRISPKNLTGNNVARAMLNIGDETDDATLQQVAEKISAFIACDTKGAYGTLTVTVQNAET